MCSINVTDVISQDDLNERAAAAAFIGTLQASYTDFHYLRDIWKKTTEKDALIGISMTGIASNAIKDLDLSQASKVVLEVNKELAKHLNINPSSRCNCIKPEGTASLIAGSSSGIHAWHDHYYIRRVRVGKNEAIYTYLSIYHPELLEDDYFRPQDTAIISIPQAAPKGAVVRTEENAIELLERIKKIYKDWVLGGHRKGENTHNVSATVSINKNNQYVRVGENKELTDNHEVTYSDEWEAVGEWMWTNRDSYNGLSVLPEDGGTYKQMPYESITKEKYEELLKTLSSIDLTKVIETVDNTNLKAEAACSGPDGCEVI